MADTSVRDGYSMVTPTVREAVNHATEALSDRIFTGFALTGALAGVVASTMVHVGDPAIIGLFCTILGSCISALAWDFGYTLWQKAHPRHD